MSIYRISTIVIAAFSLAACSQDESDEDVSIDARNPDAELVALAGAPLFDGMGDHHLTIAKDGSGTMFYDPFNPSAIPEAVKRGVKL